MAELFAFDSSGADGWGTLRIVDIRVRPGLSDGQILSLLSRVGWPPGHPLAEAVRRAMEGTAPPEKPDQPGGDRDRRAGWHPIPYQGIDGRVGDFDLLVGTAEFIEDAGIVLPDWAGRALADYERQGWAGFLVGACHVAGRDAPPRRSLLAVVGVAADGRASARFSPEVLPGVAVGPQTPCEETPRSSVHPAPYPAAGWSGSPVGASALRELTAGLPQPADSPLASSPRLVRFPRRRVLILAGLVGFSAVSGLALSIRTVAPDEVAVVRRLGRTATMLGPGLHVRPLWFMEDIRRLQPGRIRTVQVSPGVVTGDRRPVPELPGESPGRPMLTGDRWPAVPPEENAATDPADGIPCPLLLSASVRVQYRIANPGPFLENVENLDALIALAAEADLRTLVADASAGELLGELRGRLAERLALGLQRRLDRLGSGVLIHDVLIDALRPADRIGEQAAADDRAEQEAHFEANRILLEACDRADRLRLEAQAAATEMLADARIAQERQVQAAADILEQVRTRLESFRRDPVRVRQEMIRSAGVGTSRGGTTASSPALGETP